MINVTEAGEGGTGDFEVCLENGFVYGEAKMTYVGNVTLTDLLRKCGPPSLSPTPAPTGEVRTLVSYGASQVLNGVDKETFLSQETTSVKTFQITVANATGGLNSDDIVITHLDGATYTPTTVSALGSVPSSAQSLGKSLRLGYPGTSSQASPMSNTIYNPSENQAKQRSEKEMKEMLLSKLEGLRDSQLPLIGSLGSLFRKKLKTVEVDTRSSRSVRMAALSLKQPDALSQQHSHSHSHSPHYRNKNRHQRGLLTHQVDVRGKTIPRILQTASTLSINYTLSLYLGEGNSYTSSAEAYESTFSMLTTSVNTGAFTSSMRTNAEKNGNQALIVATAEPNTVALTVPVSEVIIYSPTMSPTSNSQTLDYDVFSSPVDCFLLFIIFNSSIHIHSIYFYSLFT